MKIKVNINYDDWKLIESNLTGLPNMNDEKNVSGHCRKTHP
jgi:hypothetical protein